MNGRHPRDEWSAKGRERETEGQRDGGTEGGEGGQKPSERVDSVLITAGTRLVNVYRVEGLTVIN